MLLDGLFLTLAADKEFAMEIPMISVNSEKSSSFDHLCGQTKANGLL